MISPCKAVCYTTRRRHKNGRDRTPICARNALENCDVVVLICVRNVWENSGTLSFMLGVWDCSHRCVCAKCLGELRLVEFMCGVVVVSICLRDVLEYCGTLDFMSKVESLIPDP